MNIQKERVKDSATLRDKGGAMVKEYGQGEGVFRMGYLANLDICSASPKVKAVKVNHMAK